MSKYFIIFMVVIFFGCRDEFWPEINKYDNLLVVDGTITNQPGPYTVRLSTSSLVQDASFDPYSGAMVKITDHLGNEEILTELESGIYQTSPSGIQGKIGNKYKLLIYTPDEKVYESSYSELIEPVGIDSIYAVIESQPTPDPEFYYWGYQFYLDTEMADSDSTNFLWRLKATYEYHSDFKIRYFYDGQLKPFPDYDSLWRCWADDVVNSNFTASVANLTKPIIKAYPLNFVNTETRKLSVRYSLEVSQYSIDDQAHKYFEQIKNINDEQGNLYTTLPYQVKGNLRNANNKSEPVLGYFLAGGKSVKRIFVMRPYTLQFLYSVCVLREEDYANVSSMYDANPRAYPIYLTFDLNYIMALPAQECMDCRIMGGSITKPDFWNSNIFSKIQY